MGKVALAGAMLALGIAGAADAQRTIVPGPGAHYPPPGPNVHYPPLPQPPIRPTPMPRTGGRWGGREGGHWWGGMNAPGGWAAYRAPRRGWRLPGYWLAPRFVVNDWSAYGFSPPPQGYTWTRYYDDAVLIDDRGDVYDTIGDVDWDGDGGYSRLNDAELAGAGVAGATGYAIDSGGDTRLGPPPPPPGGYRAPMPPPRHEERIERRIYDHGPGPGYPPPAWVSGDGRTTVTVTTSGGSPVVFAPPAYAYGYGGVTTVTVQSAPVVTTTTTEIIEDSVTYTRPVVHRVDRKRVWRPRPKARPRPSCACGS